MQFTSLQGSLMLSFFGQGSPPYCPPDKAVQDWWTPLRVAARQGHQPIVSWLELLLKLFVLSLALSRGINIVAS